MARKLVVDDIEVPQPAQILISPKVLRPEHSGFWRAVLVRTSPTTTRCIGYVYAGEL